MTYDFVEDIHSINGRNLADDEARKANENISAKTTLLSKQAKDKIDHSPYLLDLLINMQTEYDSNNKYSHINAGSSVMEHESSLMKVSNDIGVYFVLNTTDTTDSSSASHNAKGCIWLKNANTIIDLTSETGIYFATGRTQHMGDTDVVIATNENDEAFLISHSASGWTAKKFTNNSGITLDGCNSQMVYENGKFYHVVAKNVASTFPVICFDPTNMTIELVKTQLTLPITFSGVYEASLFKFNDLVYVALRPSYASLRRGYLGQALIGIIQNLASDPVVKEYILLPDGSSRVLLFSKNDRLFCITNGFDRTTGKLFEITNLYAYEPIARILNNINYPDILFDGSNTYWCATDKKNNESGCKIVFGSFQYSDLLK